MRARSVLLAAALGLLPLASGVAQPIGQYTDDTVSLSYPMLEWIHRNLNKPRAIDHLRADYPAAVKLKAFLSGHIGAGMANSIAVISIVFTTGREQAHYKMSNDYGAGMPRVEGWNAAETRNVAALCIASSLRQIQWEADRQAVRAKSTSLETAWKLVNLTTDDPLVPTEEAGLLARDFLVGLEKSDPRLDKLNTTIKADILDFRDKFKSQLNQLVPLKKPLPMPPDMERFRDYFNAKSRIELDPD